MNKIETPLQGAYILEPKIFADDRGYFYESYNADALKNVGISTAFVQDNHSYSIAGVLRGIHFQLPHNPITKLVRCTRGRVWDLAVDLRKESPTYLQWHAEELSAENKKMFFIPEGFGHAFYAFEESEVLYKCSTTYDTTADAGIVWNDSDLQITWPFDVNTQPLLSEKDRIAPQFRDLDIVFPYLPAN